MHRLFRKTSQNRLTPFNGSVILFSIAMIVFSSCKTTEKSYYFKTIPRDTTIKAAVLPPEESKIRKGDLLSINVSSLNPQEDLIYNSPAIGNLTSNTSTAAPTTGYLVDVFGNIQYHRLGTIRAEGMTRRELKEKIQKDIQPYLKDAIVTVRYMNHKISILGEIGKPQVIQMPEERLSLLDALASSGDVTQFARRDNLLVIRETPDGKQMKRINLENHSIFSSDWFYLQPDDVVYIEPNDKKVNEENRNRKFQTISMVMSGVTVAIIILDRIFRN